ncbi:Chromosome transmission fidelity protein 18 [Malassezia sp. CBS 17886]|nr:Chromosome transmission fidelity protein 18 [Malassezia sp. CBS 17886]
MDLDDDLDALLAAEEGMRGAPPHGAHAHAGVPSVHARTPEDPLFFGEADAMDEDSRAGPAHEDGAAARLHPRAVSPLCAPAPAPRGLPRGVPRYIPAEPIAVQTMSGEIVVLPRRRRTKGWRAAAMSVDEGTPLGLLSAPVHRVMAEMETEKRTQRDADAPLSTRTSGAGSVPQKAHRAAADHTMWVDRYRPHTFSELLGDDRVHRDALRWVKEWDPCVFGRRAPPRASRARQAEDADEDDLPRDPYGRPRERVLLIAGPPGLGKTTLAHVIAQQAGYRVYEMNASDARTAADVEGRVRSALESDSLRGEGRPTLVVIDEIDGATGGGGGGDAGGGDALGSASFVRALVRLVERGEGAPLRFRGTGRGGRKGAKPLLRPIMCVCNDLYAPALRALRPLARILRFHRAPTPLMARRLADICAHEGLGAEKRSLSLLCELTHGDMRACLNVLEMLHGRAGRITDRVIAESTVGIKDSVVPLQRLWTQLFRTLDARHADFMHTARRGAARTPPDRLAPLVHALVGFAEYDKLAHGCFEHYPQLRVRDQGWERYRDAHDWLHFAHTLTQRSFGGGSGNTAFELLGFLPWSFVPWHLLFAHVGNPVPEQQPRADYENHMRLSEMRELIDSVHSHLPAHARSFYSRRDVATDLGPALVHILSPDVKLANHRATSDTRASLDALVDTMLALDLSFEVDRAEDGSIQQKLHPPLDRFGEYSDEIKCDVGPSRHGVRAFVQREMEATRRRRESGGRCGAAPAAKERVEALPPVAAGAALVDFFGRPVANVAAGDAEDARALGLRVFYRYHEGYSNAVRKAIRLGDLL